MSARLRAADATINGISIAPRTISLCFLLTVSSVVKNARPKTPRPVAVNGLATVVP